MKDFLIALLLVLVLSIPAFCGLSDDAKEKWQGIHYDKTRVIWMLDEGFDSIDIAYGTEPATPDTGKGTFWATGDVVYVRVPGGSSLSLLDMMRTTYDTDDDDRIDVAEAISDGTTEITAGQVMYEGLSSVYFGTIAAGTSDERPVFIAPYDCELIIVQLVNASAIATDAVSYTTVALLDKSSTGASDNQVAAISTDTTAFAAFDSVSIGTLDATHKLLTSGDVVSLKKTDTAGGTATDEMMVMITYKRR